LLKLLEEYLTYGGFPLVAGKNDFNDKKELVKSYYETIFYKDIVERYKVKSVDIMEAIISNILDNNSCLFSVTSFEKTLKEKGIKASKKTISLFTAAAPAFFSFTEIGVNPCRER